MDILKLVERSFDLDELHKLNVLPEPYDDTGFFYIYYAQSDYKRVLPEIISYIEKGLRIYYNRYYDKSKSFIQDYLTKVKSAHCRCAVIYLSENAVKDPVLYKLLKIILNTGCNYLSINLPVKEKIISGFEIADTLVAEQAKAQLLKTLFKKEITYIPFNIPLTNKIEELKRAYRFSPVHYSLFQDFAVANYVYDLQEEEIIIPQEVVIGGKVYTVKAVARGAFANCENLKKIVFPKTLEYIGFLGCEFDESQKNVNSYKNLDAFNVNSLVNEINGTFFRCKKLQEIVFPKNVKRLYKYEFCGCVSLKRLILNSGLKFYNFSCYEQTEGFFRFDEDGLFDKDKSTQSDVAECDIVLEQLKVPETICKVKGGNFKVCLTDLNSGWRDIELSANDISGYSVFENAERIFLNKHTYNIPDTNGLKSVEYDGEWEFSEDLFEEYVNCVSLIKAVLPDKVENLTSTFVNCSSLNFVKLPNRLKIISGAFENCTSLKSIVLPDSLECLYSSAFSNSAIEEIKIPENVIIIENDVFYGCESLHTVISDSNYNNWLFSYKKNRAAQLQECKHKKLFYLKIFFAYLTLPFLHPVLFFKLLFCYKNIKFDRLPFFEICPIRTIYLKKGKKSFKIKRYRKVPSDKAGYFKYIRK